MKDFLMGTLATVAFAAAIIWAIFYGTSAEVWYAGEHTAGCDMTEDCGCYERLTGGANK